MNSIFIDYHCFMGLMDSNFEGWQRIVVMIHILAGVLSLLTGMIAIAANPKGNKLHRRVGLMYFWAMFVIFATALVMVTTIHFNLFLLVIAIFSFYMAFTGYRALKRKKPNQVNLLDKSFAWFGLLSGVFLVLFGAYSMIFKPNLFSIILPLTFGSILSSNAYRDILHFRKTEYSKMWWWFHHLNFMLTSFIAAITAFLVNNIYKWVDIGNYNFIFWLLPTVVLLPFIIRWNNHYRKKFKV